MKDELERAVVEFASETREGLASLEADLLAAEADPAASVDVGRMFRVVHTIKRTCGFFAFGRVERVAHAAEGVLARVREGGARLDADLVSALLTAVDVLRRLVADAERTQREAEVDVQAVLERLAGSGAAASREPSRRDDVRAQEPRRHEPADHSVRVDLGLLDELMTLVGELVLVRNQALQCANHAPDSRFQAPVQRLNLVATELQQAVMKTRMQPIANAWSGLPRLARDLALQCGKKVRLELEGGSTELDRTIMDAVRDPLTHLVRNAIDHGIEPPAARSSAGKPVEGRVRLRAHHEGGTVIVEVSDDGAGVDLARVTERAVHLGLLGAEDAATAGADELAQLVFRPGLSTAPEVTTVSGRGVGLDVVRSNLEHIGGTVDLHSEAGLGATVRLKIPLTLAIISALVVTSGGQRYLIPQVNVLEIVRVDARAGLERVLGAPVFRLRGRLLTLLDLDRELDGRPRDGAPEATPSAHVVVVRAETATFGLVVDDVLETEEIVVKPLPRLVRTLGAYSGATIMGDGRVALILDAAGLARRIGSEARGREASTPGPRVTGGERLLLVEVCGGERAAVPLAAVARLEELAPERIERSGGVEVVQYRGEILPLVEVSRALGRAAPRPAAALLPVVVHAGGHGSVGLIVERIVDVVEEEGAVARRGAPRAGVLGTAIVQQRVTQVLDVAALVRGVVAEGVWGNLPGSPVVSAAGSA